MFAYMLNKGVFSMWNDLQNFQNFDITDDNSVVSWGNSIDMSVDCVHENIFSETQEA